MVGFTQYCPSVLALVVDREIFYPFIVHSASEDSIKRINQFLETSDNRIKVIMFDSIDVLKDILDVFDLNNVKIVVLDTIKNLSRAVLEIKDAQKKPDGSYQFFSITPSSLNSILRDCEMGIPKSGIKNITDNYNPKIIRDDVVYGKINSGDLGIMINSFVSKLGNREKFLVSELIMKYIVGIINKRKFSSICNKYDIPHIERSKIEEYVSSNEGINLKLSFIDTNVYHTEKDIALKEFKVNVEDYKLLISFLPIDKEYEYSVKIPSILIKKRKEK